MPGSLGDLGAQLLLVVLVLLMFIVIFTLQPISNLGEIGLRLDTIRCEIFTVSG